MRRPYGIPGSNNNMKPLSDVFLAAGTVVCVKKTWMVLLQFYKTDASLHVSRSQTSWSIHEVSQGCWHCCDNSCLKTALQGGTYCEAADHRGGNFEHKLNTRLSGCAVRPCLQAHLLVASSSAHSSAAGHHIVGVTAIALHSMCQPLGLVCVCDCIYYWFGIFSLLVLIIHMLYRTSFLSPISSLSKGWSVIEKSAIEICVI